jgi:hypothetical protein
MRVQGAARRTFLVSPSPLHFKLAPLENGGRGPGNNKKTWIPASAGMTTPRAFAGVTNDQQSPAERGISILAMTQA